MKRIISCLAVFVLVLNMTSCEIESIINEIINETDIFNNKLNDVLVEWETDGFDADSDHNVIDQDDYYRYNELRRSEKELYDTVRNAVDRGVSIIDLSEFLSEPEDVEKVFRCFLADNPQLFYVSRNCHYMYDVDSGCVTNLLVKYTDGDVTDEFDDNCRLTKTADREVISDKIDELEDAVEDVLEIIPLDCEPVEKEKLICDYLVDNIVYIETDSDFDIDETIPHEYDVYGAICNGEAVCEGYAKAFQLLCYMSGINAIQVEGTGNGEDHMWNAVELDDWYYVDVTWADIGDYDYPYYSYFNITEEELLIDHRIDDSVLDVPDCDSKDLSYYNYFAAKAVDLYSEPLNYKKCADDIQGGKCNYVIIYADGFSLTESYLEDYFLNEDSVFNQYVRAMGYGIELKWEYYLIDNYYYIPANKR